MALHPADLPQAAREFLAERHLATLTTMRPDGSPHVVPVAFTWDAGALVALVIASGGTRKVRNAEAGCRAVLCQVDGRRWLSLEGNDVRGVGFRALARSKALPRLLTVRHLGNPGRDWWEQVRQRFPGMRCGRCPSRTWTMTSRFSRPEPVCGLRVAAVDPCGSPPGRAAGV